MKLITVYRGINKLAPFTAIFRFARLEPNGTKLIILPERHSKYKIQEKKIYHQTELENLSLGLGTRIISRDNQRKISILVISTRDNLSLRLYPSLSLCNKSFCPLLHTGQYVMPCVNPGMCPNSQSHSHVHLHQILRLHLQNLLRRSSVQNPNQTRTEPLRDLRIAIHCEPRPPELV